MTSEASAATAAPTQPGNTVFPVIVALSFCHFLNDMMQSLVPALYPVLKASYQLDFGQIGLITLAFQCSASLLQPVVEIYTDRHPLPYSLPIGMASTLCGLLLLSSASSYPLILLAAAMIGMGSAVFHPEASRIARLASGGRYGLAQSLFQVGGNTGSASGPLLAAFIVVPLGQSSLVWFSAAALIGILLLTRAGAWYAASLRAGGAGVGRRGAGATALRQPRRTVAIAITVLIALLFSKNVYSASMTSYFTFYLIDRFDLSVPMAQLFLFIFLASLVAGTLAGGVVADRVGRLPVIWFSILGPLPFTLALPYAGLVGTIVLSILIAVMMSSAFAAILVYAQELLPGRVGLVGGVFFGLSFGLGGLGAAALGQLADLTSIATVYKICSFLPLLGLLTFFLPPLDGAPARATPAGTEPKSP